MRMLWAIILTGALMLPLAACGGGPAGTEAPEAGQSAAPVSETPDASAQNELALYEPVTVDDVEFVIMGSGFFARGPLALEPLELDEEDETSEEVFAVVYFGVGNAGQTACTVPGGIIDSLDYNNGFQFPCNASSVIDGANWSNSSRGVSADTNPLAELVSLPPLSSPVYGAAVFTVPREVMENESAPLLANIVLGEQTFTYRLRPSGDTPDVYASESELVQEVQAQYDTAWLIRNIGYYSELAYDNVGFAWKYAGNTNGAGERAFAEEFMEKLTDPYAQVYQRVPAERIAALLPETAAAMEALEGNIDTLYQLLTEMGETNSAEYVPEIQNAASAAMGQISDMLGAEEMVQFGRFTTITGRLDSI